MEEASTERDNRIVCGQLSSRSKERTAMVQVAQLLETEEKLNKMLSSNETCQDRGKSRAFVHAAMVNTTRHLVVSSEGALQPAESHALISKNSNLAPPPRFRATVHQPITTHRLTIRPCCSPRNWCYESGPRPGRCPADGIWASQDCRMPNLTDVLQVVMWDVGVLSNCQCVKVVGKIEMPLIGTVEASCRVGHSRRGNSDWTPLD